MIDEDETPEDVVREAFALSLDKGLNASDIALLLNTCSVPPVQIREGRYVFVAT
ncbi:hypothetical protein [Streptomyces sp. NPDC057253]|uniref:hypothetical protein n=1 Tax=Streptomyces sp. NPDC057253 TaxID=3346069 RepID=UPI003627C260